MTDLTLKTKIYISTLYVWVHTLYYFSLICTNILWFFITYMPDSCIIYKIPFIKNKTDELEVIDAFITKDSNGYKKDTKNSRNIKNAMKLLINVYWDYTINNIEYNKNILDDASPGGIDLDKIFNAVPEFKESLIWIKYIKKIQDIFENKENSDSDKSNNNNFGEIQEILISSIKLMNNSESDTKYDIYKNNDFSKNYKNIFNEISL